MGVVRALPRANAGRGPGKVRKDAARFDQACDDGASAS